MQQSKIINSVYPKIRIDYCPVDIERERHVIRRCHRRTTCSTHNLLSATHGRWRHVSVFDATRIVDTERAESSHYGRNYLRSFKFCEITRIRCNILQQNEGDDTRYIGNLRRDTVPRRFGTVHDAAMNNEFVVHFICTTYRKSNLHGIVDSA